MAPPDGKHCLDHGTCQNNQNLVQDLPLWNQSPPQPKSLGLPTIRVLLIHTGHDADLAAGLPTTERHSTKCINTSKTSHTTVVDDERCIEGPKAPVVAQRQARSESAFT